MNINMKGAASNCYFGLKAMFDVIESYQEHSGDIEELISDLDDIAVKFQPLLAAYSMNCHFNEPGSR